MPRKQISDALFKKIVAGLEKLGISLSEVLGTRTGVKKIGKSLTTGDISRIGIQTEFERGGVDKILRLFKEDARYLHEMNELEGTKFLDNLNTANKVINPPPLPEAGIFSLKEGKKLTSEEFLKKEAADRAKIDSATLKAAMETSKVDQDLAKKLNLDMSKASDFDKLQAWKKQHDLPDWGSQEGIGSLFKTRQQNELADLGTQLDAIESEGKSLADEAKKLVDMAWKMSPEGQFAEESARKALLKRMNEGKGFAGGVFGARNDGFFRAVVRPFLLDQHAKGKIKLADNTLESLKNADDLKGGGDFMSADPVRVFRQHYGDDAFDLIPEQEAFGGGRYGPTSQERIDVLEKVIGEPVMKVGPDNPGGYLTKGEYQAKLDERDEVLGYIKNKEGRFSNMSQQEIAEEIADVNRQHDSIKMAMDIDYPKVTKTALNLRLMKNFDQPLDDIGLAEEGYNVQEIQVLKNARNRMTTGEEIHPNEALLREKEILADDAGIDVDELELDIDWGDMTPEPMAQGGRVGYRYGTGEEGVQSLPVDQMQEIEGHMAGVADDDLVQRRANELALEIFGVEDYFTLTDRLQNVLWRRAERELNEKAQGGGVGSMFRRV